MQVELLVRCNNAFRRHLEGGVADGLLEEIIMRDWTPMVVYFQRPEGQEVNSG
jgi:hypothetical protein